MTDATTLRSVRRRHVCPAMVLASISVLVVTACAGSATPSTAAPHTGPTATAGVIAPTSTSTPSPAPTGPLVQRAELSLPVAREETAAAATSDTLMVAGGFDIAGRDRAEVFLLTGGVWRNGPQLPLALDHPSAAQLGGTLYVAGGFSAGVAQGAVESLAPAGAAWTSLPPLGHPRGALALLAFAGRLYAVGGKLGGGAEVAAVESWAPGEPAWSELAPLPGPRDHVAGFVLSDRLCVAGGRSPATARVDCLGAGGAWSPATALSTPTSGAAAGTVGSVAIVAGGEDAAETRLTGQVDTLTAAGWTTAPMLAPRHGVEGALFQGRLWLCGGGTAPGLHATATCTSIG